MPPPRDAARKPTRVEPVPGTPFGLAIYHAPPAAAGPAVGSMVAGIAAIGVSLVVGCLGLLDAAATAGGQPGGWGLLVGGAFGALAGFLGLVAVALGVVGLRQTQLARQPAGEPVRGRGMAIAGLCCGGAGMLVVVCALGLAFLVTVA